MRIERNVRKMPNDNWIKCSERLPDISGEYHVIVSNPGYTRRFGAYRAFASKTKEWTTYNEGDIVISWEISPPKESDDENEKL